MKQQAASKVIRLGNITHYVQSRKAITCYVSSLRVWLLIISIFCFVKCRPESSEDVADSSPGAEISADGVSADLPDTARLVGDGSDSPDVEFVPVPCPVGPNPHGNGCLLPCEDGWHEGANGLCVVDCPSFLETDEAGDCTVPKCDNGWRIKDWDHTWEGETYSASTCVRACPEGMEEHLEGGSLRCTLPCADGASRKEDGYCHLDCPAGMSLAEAGPDCNLNDVGEDKTCPPGQWDQAFEGPNPLFVSAGADRAGADGSADHPFPSISEAVAAASGSVTIFVAPGQYNEQVVVEDFSQFNLVGACASQTTIVAEGMDVINGWYAGAISVFDVDKVHIQGFSVQSDQGAVLVVHDGVGESATVADMRLLELEGGGILVAGAFEQVAVRDNLVSDAKDWGIYVAGDVDFSAVQEVHAEIVANEIYGLQACQGWDWCVESGIVMGIIIGVVSSALVEGNFVHDYDHASGMWIWDVPSHVVRGNLFSELVGHSAITATCWVACDGIVEDNRVHDCQAGNWGGYGAYSFSGVTLCPNGHKSTFIVQRNHLGNLQGMGLQVLDDGSPGSEVVGVVLHNEFEQLPWAMELSAPGTYQVVGNTVSESMVAVTTNPTALSVELIQNVFRDGVTTDYGLPPSSLKNYLQATDAQLKPTTDYELGNVVFQSNIVRAFPPLPAAWSAVLLLSGGATGFIADNVFEENTSSSVVYNTACADLEVTGNRFVGIDPSPSGPAPDVARSAVLVSLGEEGFPISTVVADNSFEDFAFGSAIHAYYWESQGTLTAERNTLYNCDSLRLESMNYGGPADVKLTDNDYLWAVLLSDSVDNLTISGSRFLASYALLDGQDADGNTTIEENLFDSCPLYLARHQGTVTVRNNELRNGDAEALEILDMTGTVLVRRNLVNHVQTYEIPLAGPVGDGIHVSGTADEPVAGVEIRENRIENAERIGVLFSGAAGIVEGNMYNDNGGECGTDCDFVIQLEPIEGAVQGVDVEFATRPAEPYGVVTTELHGGL